MSSFRPVACWSKAGIGTCIVLEYKNEKKNNENDKGARVTLDLGATPCFTEALSSDVVLISHGHLDHIGAIFSHARAVSCSRR